MNNTPNIQLVEEKSVDVPMDRNDRLITLLKKTPSTLSVEEAENYDKWLADFRDKQKSA